MLFTLNLKLLYSSNICIVVAPSDRQTTMSFYVFIIHLMDMIWGVMCTSHINHHRVSGLSDTLITTYCLYKHYDRDICSYVWCNSYYIGWRRTWHVEVLSHQTNTTMDRISVQKSGKTISFDDKDVWVLDRTQYEIRQMNINQTLPIVAILYD